MYDKLEDWMIVAKNWGQALFFKKGLENSIL